MTIKTLLVFVILAWVSLAQDPYSARVIAITEGDSIRVLYDGLSERIRLWGIDAPELKQPFGTKALEYVGELAFQKTVTVVVKGKDRYRRIIADVVLPDGRQLCRQSQIIECGQRFRL